MKPSILYRVAAVLILLFDLGHTLGFRQSDPGWGAGVLLDLMHSIHFNMQGFNRTYWDLFVGMGFSVSVFLLFAAVVAWQLGSFAPEMSVRMRGIQWALAVCFLAMTILSWRYLFLIPLVFNILITVCLVAAAWVRPRAGEKCKG